MSQTPLPPPAPPIQTSQHNDALPESSSFAVSSTSRIVSTSVVLHHDENGRVSHANVTYTGESIPPTLPDWLPYLLVAPNGHLPNMPSLSTPEPAVPMRLRRHSATARTRPYSAIPIQVATVSGAPSVNQGGGYILPCSPPLAQPVSSPQAGEISIGPPEENAGQHSQPSVNHDGGENDTIDHFLAALDAEEVVQAAAHNLPWYHSDAPLPDLVSIVTSVLARLAQNAGGGC